MSNGNFCEAAADSAIRTGWEDSTDGRLLRRDWRSFRIPSRRPRGLVEQVHLPLRDPSKVALVAQTNADGS